MKRFRAGVLAVFQILMVFCAVSARGQAGSGDMTGEVHDTSGGRIADAKVTLTRGSTGEVYLTVSTNGGVYSFSSLKPGVYSVGVEANGFKKLMREGVVVSTGNTTRVDLHLTVGSVSDVVTVSGDASPLTTESATL